MGWEAPVSQYWLVAFDQQSRRWDFPRRYLILDVVKFTMVHHVLEFDQKRICFLMSFNQPFMRDHLAFVVKELFHPFDIIFCLRWHPVVSLIAWGKHPIFFMT